MRRLQPLAPGVLVATARKYATASTVVLAANGTGEALVVDPSWDEDELADLAADVADLGARCAGGLATHAHYDHLLWHPALGDVPRWASPGTAARLAADRAGVLAPLAGDLPEPLIDLAGRVRPVPGGRAAARVPAPEAGGAAAPVDAYPLPWTGREILLHEHDAHAPAHLAVEIVEAGVLLAGDLLSDVELPMPTESAPDLESYLAGLDRLAPVVARAGWLVPGHGSPTDHPLRRLDADRSYLDALLAGWEPDDPRLDDPEMAGVHAANVRRARAGRQDWSPGGLHS